MHHVKSEHEKDEDDDLDDDRKPELGHHGHHSYYQHSMSMGGHYNHHHHNLKTEIDTISKNQTGSDCGVPIPASKPKIWSLADTAACKSLGLSDTPTAVPFRQSSAHAAANAAVTESATEPANAAPTATPAAYGDGHASGKWNRHSWYEYDDNFRTPQSINEWNDEYVRRQFSIFPLRGVSNNRYAPYPTANAGAASVYQPQSYGLNNAGYTEQYRPAYYSHAPTAEPNEQQSNEPGVSRSSNR
jgi:hypothetical protein